MRYGVAILCCLCLCSCSGLESVRVSAGYGPFSAEIEFKMQAAAALEAKNGKDCPQAAALRQEIEQLKAAASAVDRK